MAVILAEGMDTTLAGPLTLFLDNLPMSRSCRNSEAMHVQNVLMQ